MSHEAKKKQHACTVLGSLLLKSNSLHITPYFEATLCITVTYYLEIKVTSNILYVTCSVKTVPFSTLGILRNTILKH